MDQAAFVRSNHDWLSIAHIPLLGGHHEEFLHLKDTRDNRRKAQKIVRALEAELREGRLEEEFKKRFPDSKLIPRLEAKQPPKELTLGEFAEKWLEEKTALTESSRYDYNSLLQRPYRPAFNRQRCRSPRSMTDI